MTSRGTALGEFGRIARYFRPLAASLPGAFALTDDAAAITVPPGLELVVTTDAIVAGVHFLPDDAPGDIARKALRVNLSDLAAKGASPLAYTLTLAVGGDIDDTWIERFAAGLALDQALYGIALIGGDSVSTPGPLWASITAFGLTAAGRMVRRSGARPGDRVLVTGAIGDAALGLAALRMEFFPSAEDRVILEGRYRLPQPRGGLASSLAVHAHAAIDISDGLAADFGHLCQASSVRGVIAAPRIPLSPAARRAVETDERLFSKVLTGGDDYEVLLAAPPESLPALHAAALAVAIDLTEIGAIEAGGAGADFLDGQGNPIKLDRTGWTHN